MSIPRERSLDSTLALLREGYLFLPRRFERLGTDAFETRLMGRRALCLQGEEAARLLYEHPFTRRGALPPNTLLSLQDIGSVNQLDGPWHRQRKALFLSLMTPDRVADLGDRFERLWREAIPRWAAREQVVLLTEVRRLITEAVCAWGGSPVEGSELDRRAREFGAMIDGAGAVDVRNWRGLLLRSRTEAWARAQVRRAREGKGAAGTPLQAVAEHQDADGRRLRTSIAAVEYLNLLRPTVAVERFIVFAALSLHEHPEWRERLAAGDPEDVAAFAQEVRRTAPFFPLLSGRALAPFVWKGRTFRKGAWVLVDIYGGHRDLRSWSDPHAFDPDRFRRWEANPYNLIPQGGGDPAHGHRCPGEPITLELLTRALRMLAAGMDYKVPPQDLTVDLGRMPALPRSGFVMAGVRPAAQRL